MKFEPKSLFSHVQKITLIEILTTVAIITLLVSIAVLYEARTASIQRMILPNTGKVSAPLAQLSLTSETIELVQDFTTQHSELALVSVVSINLTENTRRVLTYKYNDKQIEAVVRSNPSVSTQTHPLFTTNVANNQQLAALLNGEFTCTSDDQGPFVVNAELVGVFGTTCRIPIPPYYGRLTGYLTMYSRKQMSIYEIDQLRAAAIKLATDIFYSDVRRHYDQSITFGVVSR